MFAKLADASQAVLFFKKGGSLMEKILLSMKKTLPGKVATFHFRHPGSKDDPVIDSLPVGVGLRINEAGIALLSFMTPYDPQTDMKDGNLIPRAAVRFNGEDYANIVTEICLSSEATAALQTLLNRHVKPVFAPLKQVEFRPDPLWR